ncbi:MAG: hypothetical protein ACD_24C00069G0001, partial [uncultured bacterium]
EKYSPYGNNPITGVTNNPIERKYTGQIKDKNTTLYYYNARYYDPVLSRFISADSVNDQQNRYAYVADNPLKNIDPRGHDLVIVGGIGGNADPNLYKSWIQTYKGWNDKEWKEFYSKYQNALSNVKGSQEENFAAANRVLRSQNIHIFNWGADTYEDLIHNAREKETIKMKEQLSKEMEGLQDITLISWSKGANLAMHYMSALDRGEKLIRPKHYILISAPVKSGLAGAATQTSRLFGPVEGISYAGEGVPSSFGSSNVVSLSAKDDIWAGDIVKNALNFQAGLHGHGTYQERKDLIAEIYSLFGVQYEHGSGYLRWTLGSGSGW